MKLQKLKLHQQNKNCLAKRDMNFLKGGVCSICRCQCSVCSRIASMDAMRCSITGMGSADHGGVEQYGCLDPYYP